MVRSGVFVALVILFKGYSCVGKPRSWSRGFGGGGDRVIVLRRLSGAHRHAQCDRPPVGKRMGGEEGGSSVMRHVNAMSCRNSGRIPSLD